MKNYYRTNPEKVRMIRDRAMAKKPGYYRRMKKVYISRVIEKIVHTVIGHYSGGTFRCSCCGESGQDFLTIDHVNGNGNKERLEVLGRYGGGYRFYRWLIKQGFPDGYDVLCMNCNLSKGKHGVCTHKRVVRREPALTLDVFTVNPRPSGRERNLSAPPGR